MEAYIYNGALETVAMEREDEGKRRRKKSTCLETSASEEGLGQPKGGRFRKTGSRKVLRRASRALSGQRKVAMAAAAAPRRLGHRLHASRRPWLPPIHGGLRRRGRLHLRLRGSAEDGGAGGERQRKPERG